MPYPEIQETTPLLTQTESPPSRTTAQIVRDVYVRWRQILFDFYDSLSPERIYQESNLGFWRAGTYAGKISIPRGFSYTFSMAVVLVNLNLNYQNADKTHLAANTLISTFMSANIALGEAGVFAAAIEISKLLGQLQNAQNANADETTLNIIRQKIVGAFQLSTIMAYSTAPLVMASYIFSADLLTFLFNQDPEVAELTQEFLRIFSLYVIFVIFRLNCEQVIFSFHHEVAAMFIALTTLAIGMSASVVFGFNLLNIPALAGARGVAIACVIEGFITACAFGLFLKFHPDFKKFNFYNFFNRIPEKKQQFLRLLTMSISMFLTGCTSVALPVVSSLMAGGLGLLPQSAWNFANQLLSMVIIPTAAFSQQCCQGVSVFAGIKNYQNLAKFSIAGLSAMLIAISPITFLAIFPNALTPTLASDAKEISGILSIVMPIMVLAAFLVAIQTNALQQLRGLEYKVGPTVITILANLIAIGLSAILAFETGLGIYGIAIGYCIGYGLAALGLGSALAYYSRPSQLEKRDNPQIGSWYTSALQYFHCCKRDEMASVVDVTAENPNAATLPVSAVEF